MRIDLILYTHYLECSTRKAYPAEVIKERDHLYQVITETFNDECRDP